MSDGAFGFGLGAGGGLVATIAGGLLLWGCPQYNVYSSRLAGEAEFVKAEQNRQIIVRQAQANLDAAGLKAQADVKRAEGIAASNKIIADGLGGPEGYLRFLWIDAMKEGKDGNTIVYVPTEAGLPVLEADRFRKDGKK